MQIVCDYACLLIEDDYKCYQCFGLGFICEGSLEVVYIGPLLNHQI